MVAAGAYVPALHAVHASDVLAPVTALYNPETQAVQPTVPLTKPLYELRVHARQLIRLLMLYFPAGHAVQTVVPVKSLYVPAAHAVHTEDVDAAATLLYDPVVHAAHAAVPVARLL